MIAAIIAITPTIMQAISNQLKYVVTNTAVGQSAPPIIPTAVASFLAHPTNNPVNVNKNKLIFFIVFTLTFIKENVLMLQLYHL